MSAESDLCFPHMDSFMLSDFSNLPDYEDFSKDIFIMNGDIDGIALLEDLDCKDGLLNDFSSSLEGIKEEDEEEDMQHSAAKVQEKSPTTKPTEEANEAAVQLLQADESEFVANGLNSSECPILDSIVNDAENLLISPRTIQTTNDMSCMSLVEEDILHSNSAPNAWRALQVRPPFELASITMNGSGLAAVVSSSVHGDQVAFSSQSRETSLKETAPHGATLKNGIMQQLSCTSENTPVLSPLRQVTASGAGGHGRVKINSVMHADTRPTITPPIFHINSPLSSPSSSSVGTPEKSSMFKMFNGQEENANKHHVNASIILPAATSAMDLALRSPQADSFHRVIPHHHVMHNGPSFSTMHRSQSSHALGQFRTPGTHVIASCLEELGAGVSSTQMPASIGFASTNNMTRFQASSSPAGLAERSPTAPMRRVFSTGDIQARHGENNVSRLEHANGEEQVGLKVGHYTFEERKVRLDRYRQKRNERNFSKKIKYACRKTLADSRPRIRGRFARTLDDSGEPLVRENGVSYDDEYDEVDMLTAHCNMPNNRAVNFWNATGMNLSFQHGH